MLKSYLLQNKLLLLIMIVLRTPSCDIQFEFHLIASCCACMNPM